MSRTRKLTMKQKNILYIKYHEYLSNCKSLKSKPILKNFLEKLISENNNFSNFKAKELENQVEQFRNFDGEVLWPRISNINKDINLYCKPNFNNHLAHKLEQFKETLKETNKEYKLLDTEIVDINDSIFKNIEINMSTQNIDLSGKEKDILEKMINEYPDFIKELNNISPEFLKITLTKLFSNSRNDFSFILEQIMNDNITQKDIKAIAYRKDQLNKFYKLINDEMYFQHILDNSGNKNQSIEAVWQDFFEKNTWIFGYSLNYIFSTSLAEKKLEQVVSGFDFNSSGKRVDALMKTNGFISSLCLIELKTHKDSLLKAVKNSYRKDCWQISDNLSGAVSQIQKTVFKTIKKQETKIDIYDDSGDPTGEAVFLVQPKTYLIIGNQEEFKGENGINIEKYSSFELFRRNLINLDIITFDELYERAKFIVEHHL